MRIERKDDLSVTDEVREVLLSHERKQETLKSFEAIGQATAPMKAAAQRKLEWKTPVLQEVTDPKEAKAIRASVRLNRGYVKDAVMAAAGVAEAD
jgi:hypothetical protein